VIRAGDRMERTSYVRREQRTGVIGIAGFLLPVYIALAAYIVEMRVRRRST
jgi:hypothetical protein